MAVVQERTVVAAAAAVVVMKEVVASAAAEAAAQSIVPTCLWAEIATAAVAERPWRVWRRTISAVHLLDHRARCALDLSDNRDDRDGSAAAALDRLGTQSRIRARGPLPCSCVRALEVSSLVKLSLVLLTLDTVIRRPSRE